MNFTCIGILTFYSIFVGIGFILLDGISLRNYIDKSKIVCLITYLTFLFLGFGIFFWVVSSRWEYSQFKIYECTHGWNWLELVNFLIISYLGSCPFGVMLVASIFLLMIYTPMIVIEV